MTALTALEIFTNPADLYASVGQTNGKWAFLIARGPQHNYKPLLSYEPVLESVESAILKVRELLEAARSFTLQELKNSKSLTTSVINPEGSEIDESQFLNADLIERIISTLRTSNTADTSAMLASST